MKDRAKGFVTGILLCALISICAFPGLASHGSKTAELFYRDIRITLNGAEITPKDSEGNIVEPFIIDGTTYLPVRAIAAALDLDADWDGNTNTVILCPAGTTTTTPAQTEPLQSRTVYITRTGSHYHYDGSCNGGTYIPSTLEEALGRGLTPCNKCVN